MATRITKVDKALNILRNYNGNNTYILRIKKDFYIDGKIDLLNDFQVEYILNNYERKPIQVNKVVKVAEWWAEKKKEELDLKFVPIKIMLCVYLGETDSIYNCYVKYTQSMEPTMAFIPKKALITNFLLKDYHDINVDFERYNRLAQRFDSERTLKPHQEEAVKFLLGRKKCILADDMGLGKTNSLSVAAIEGNFDVIIIICPASLKNNWKQELMWYVPERDIKVVDGFNSMKKDELEKLLGYGEGKSGKKKDELLQEAKENGKWSDNRFVIVNFDTLNEFYQIPTSRSKANIDAAYQESPMLQCVKDKKSLLIIDEAHRLSNSTSNQYKIIKDFIKRGNPDSIYLSTGTPVTNNPKNLLCLLRLIDGPTAADYNYYMEHYCGAKKIPAKGEWHKWLGYWLSREGLHSWDELSPKQKDRCREYIITHAKTIMVTDDNGTNLDELMERVSPIYLRRVKEDLTDIEVSKTVHELFYDLTPEQKAEYDKLWEEYEASQEDDKELNKDLLEGAIYRRYISNQMVPNTISIVDKLLKRGEKVIIACCYDEELYTLRDYYGDKCVIYNGKLTLKKKDEAKDKFLNDPNVMVFIGNIDSAGVGLTLTVARYLIFNNVSYVPSDDRQMEDRIYRIGQKRDVHIVYQIFRETQYENMWNIIMRKELCINKIIKKEDEKNNE